MNELGNTPADKNYKPSGISMAEERAQAYENGLDYYHYTGDNPSVAYKAGYKQAEKDLALTWKDMREIIRIDEEMIDDPEAHPEWMEEQPFYEEMLRRFKETKQ